MTIRWLGAVVLVFLFSAQAAEPVRRLQPADEGTRNESFAKFRENLKRVIVRKDARSLMRIVAVDIQNSFGGDNGAANFRKMWKPQQTKSDVWKVLALVLDMGGTFDKKGAFEAPYVFSTFPADLDGFESVVVTKKGAVMRSEPKSDASVVRELDYDILTLTKGSKKLQHEASPDDWVEVKDAAGKVGFVLQREVRSPIDFRAAFVKRKGSWRMTDLVVGD